MTREEDDKYFAAIGRIVTIASNADLVLFNTFRTLTSLPAGMASSIYYALEVSAHENSDDPRGGQTDLQ